MSMYLSEFQRNPRCIINAPLISIDTVCYYVDPQASSLLLKVFRVLKMNFLCKLWTSNLGSHGSPVNFLHQLESEKVPSIPSLISLGDKVIVILKEREE